MTTYQLQNTLRTGPSIGWAITKQNKIAFIAVHVVLAVIFDLAAPICTLWIYGFIFYSLYRIVSKRNRDGWAHIAAGYAAGLELVFRIAEAPSVPYEMGKYLVTLFLLMGLFFEENKSKKYPVSIIIYFLLLLPSISLVSLPSFEIIRKNVSFNLSGPLSLMMSAIYFYKRKFVNDDLGQIIFMLAAALIGAVTIILLRMPSLAALGEISQSNDALSGGFGPNQVSTILGFGFFALFTCWLLEINVTGSRILDISISTVLFCFAMFTFSRGGVITALSGAACVIVVRLIHGEDVKKTLRVIRLLFVIALVAVAVFAIIDTVTKGSLSRRYLEAIYGDNYYRHEEVGQKHDIEIGTSGRGDIVERDLKIFQEYIIAGVGPSMAGYVYKIHSSDDNIAAHTEYSRLLAEHGILGLIGIIILIFNPFAHYQNSNGITKTILVGFVIMASITMLHSAMRVVMPGFFYGLGLINVYRFTTSHPLQRKLK